MKQTSSDKGSVGLAQVLVGVLVLTTLAMAATSIIYIGKYNDASTNLEGHKAEAAEAAKAEQKEADEKAFAEREKQPYRKYTGPVVLGSLTVEFPKNWNVFAIENEQANRQLDIFVSPEVVRDEDNYQGPYSLRLSLERQLYTQVLEKYQKQIEKGELQAVPATMSGIQGTRLSGQLDKDHRGVMVLVPVRDKTLSVWTEADAFVGDFNTIVERVSVIP
jgi:hypothetical protein